MDNLTDAEKLERDIEECLKLLAEIFDIHEIDKEVVFYSFMTSFLRLAVMAKFPKDLLLHLISVNYDCHKKSFDEGIQKKTLIKFKSNVDMDNQIHEEGCKD